MLLVPMGQSFFNTHVTEGGKNLSR